MRGIASRRIVAGTGVVLGLSLLAAGCGSSSGSSKAAASTAAAVTSRAPLAFRSLERGERTGFATVPASAGTERVVEDDAGWQALWTEHMTGTSPARARPAVDFAQERVVALFHGERPAGGFGVEVVGVAEVASDTYEVSYVTTRPTGAPVGSATAPYHFVAVNRDRGAFSFVDVTTAPAVTPVVDLHGTLVLAPTHAGGETLAFLGDGATEAHEVVDPAALAAAGARPGRTLVVSGDAEPNVAGATALAGALRVVTFALDDVAVTARRPAQQAAGVVAVVDVEGVRWELTGPLAAAVAAAPADRPLRVTGRLDATHTPSVRGARGLVATSWRATATVSLRAAGGLLGLDETFAVDDLPASGAWRLRHDMVAAQPGTALRQGRGRLETGVRADLEGRVAAADLRAQPTVFQPTFPILDAPTTTLAFADAQGDVSIRIEAGATLPAPVDALVQALRALAQTRTTFRTLERGGFSGEAQERTVVVRDAAAWQALWAQHAGTGPGAVTAPQVDFTRQLVVGVFLGRKPSGGYAVEVQRLERDGRDVLLAVQRTAPAPGAIVTTVLTAPFHLVVVDHHGATGDVFVDGVRR